MASSLFPFSTRVTKDAYEMNVGPSILHEWVGSCFVQLGHLLALPVIASLQGKLAHGVIIQRKIHINLPRKVGGIHCHDGRERAWTHDFCQNALEHVSRLIHHFGSEIECTTAI